LQPKLTDMVHTYKDTCGYIWNIQRQDLPKKRGGSYRYWIADRADGKYTVKDNSLRLVKVAIEQLNLRHNISNKPKTIETAADLLKRLQAIKKEYGTLDVPISVYVNDDRYSISFLDIFTDNMKDNERLHSIDINI